MNYDNIKDLLVEITKTDITSLNLEIDNVKIQIERNNNIIVNNTNIPQHTENIHQAINEPTVIVDKAPTIGTIILAPIVGTYYKSSSPTAKPFVEVGQRVKKGDVLYIIEAMKIINEITSEVDGEVLEILVEDNEFVEFNQHIMTIG